MSKIITKEVAEAFKGAPSADKDLGKATDTVVIHVDLGKGQTENVRISRQVAAILKDGMQQAQKVDTFWKDNAERIVLEFYPRAEKQCEDMTAKEVKAYLRNHDDGKAWATLYSALVQQSQHWTKAALALAKMESLVKGSDEYDREKHVFYGYKLLARGLANRQRGIIAEHFARMAGSDTKSGEDRHYKGARMLIEEAITDWSALVLNQRKPFDLPAERVLLGTAVAVLRDVLKAHGSKVNFQNAIVPPKEEADMPKVKEPNGMPTKGRTTTIKAKTDKPALV